MLLLTGCAPVHQRGKASWYGPRFVGKKTASGKTYWPWKRTAAHPSLPFGTVVKVIRTDGDANRKKKVRVVITDRGPFVEGRIIDLSRRAARRLDMLDDGVATVEIRIVGCRRSYRPCR